MSKDADGGAENAQRGGAPRKAEVLAELVDYREGSIVSRSVIKKDTGSVTLFAFDAGEGLSEHTAPFDALVFIIDGEAEVYIEGRVYHLRKGEIIIMPADKPHYLKAAKRFKMSLTMIKQEGHGQKDTGDR